MIGRVRQAWRRRRHRTLEQRMAGPRLLRAFADTYSEVTFAEIGANDGEQHDFLRPLILAGGWRGVIVEPVPYVFERLKANYGDVDRLVFENVAVGAGEGQRPFYHLAEVADYRSEGLPQWYDGIGSFSRDEVVSHMGAIPDIESRLIETDVAVVTLDTLCHRNGIERLDLLLVDTEGHDWEILRSVDFRTCTPRIVIYEHYHLSAEDRAACREYLHDHGYETMEEHFDTFCLDTRTADDVTRLWTRLEPAVPGIAAYEEGEG